MKIDLYCVGMCRDNGKPTQLAGCGIVIVFTDDHNRTKFRTYKYGLGNSTQNLADLQAARLALASIKSSFRSANTHLHTNSNYVAQMLSKEGRAFIAQPNKNVDVINDLRRWFNSYDKIWVVVENQNDDNMQQAKDFAEMGLATQERSDSGTLDGFDTVG